MSENAMTRTLFVVTYMGPFGFIKPWTAVRDGETYSQQFLTPSIVEGMRQKLEVSTILRHRLAHQGFSVQLERIQSGGWNVNSRNKMMSREMSILKRGVLLNPVLHLAFQTEEEALHAADQHLCLCRNEDVVLPQEVTSLSKDAFDAIPGFELLFGNDHAGAFLVGYNRFDEGRPMYGALTIVGNPTEVPPLER